MIVKCIKCGIIWNKDEGDHNELSGSICNNCLFEQLMILVRKRQRKEGNFDCFGKSDGYCDQSGCCYHEMCITKGKVIRIGNNRY